jgi:hypothetical protein
MVNFQQIKRVFIVNGGGGGGDILTYTAESDAAQPDRVKDLY